MSADTGEVLKGAKVEAHAGLGFTESWPGARAVTDARGFALLKIPWYSVGARPRIVVTHAGYFTTHVLPAATAPTTIKLAGLGALRRLVVRVRSGSDWITLGSDGDQARPHWIDGAVLRLSSTGPGMGMDWGRSLVVVDGARTDLRCPVGKVHAILACPGRAPVRAAVTVPARGAVPQLEFEEPLIVRKVIIGRVVDRETGRPISGAKVTIATWRDIETKSDENGEYRLEGVDPSSFMQGIVPVSCEHPDFGFRIAGVKPSTWNESTRVASLTLHGEAINKVTICRFWLPDGTPAAFAFVVAEFNRRMRVLRTDADGRVALPRILRHSAAAVVVFDSKHVASIPAPRLFKEATARLYALGMMRARVVVEGPSKRPSVSVMLDGERGHENPLWFLPLTSQGRCEGPVPRAPDSIVALGTMFRFELRWSAAALVGGEIRELRLPVSRIATTCVGRVRNGEGKPMAGLRVHFTIVYAKPPAGLLPEVHVVTTDKSGRFQFFGPAGPYAISFPRTPGLSLVTPRMLVRFANGKPVDCVVRGDTR